MLKREYLINFCAEVFDKLSMDYEKSIKTSEILVEADMIGHTTHGVRLLSSYVEFLFFCYEKFISVLKTVIQIF